MKLYRISAMLWASSPWINKGVPAMKCHKWPEQIMHIDATGAYGFASLRRTSTSNCGKHQLWAVVWYKDSCWPASTQVSTCQHIKGRKKEKLTASLHRGVLHRLGSTCGDGSHQRRLSHLRQSFDKISTCFSRFSLVVLWEWNVWSSHKNDLKSAAFTDFHQISTGFHNLKKWCEYSVESLQSKEPDPTVFPVFLPEDVIALQTESSTVGLSKSIEGDFKIAWQMNRFRFLSIARRNFSPSGIQWIAGKPAPSLSRAQKSPVPLKQQSSSCLETTLLDLLKRRNTNQKHPAKNKQFAKCSDTLLIAHKAGSWSSKLLKCKRKPLKRSSIPSSAIKVASLPLSALIPEIFLHLPFTSITFSEILTTMAWLALWVPISWICIRSCFKPATVKAVKAVNVKLAQGKLCSVQARALPKATPVWRQSTQKHKEFIGCHC